MTVDVTVDGTSLEGLVSARDNHADVDQLGAAKVKALNTPLNRSTITRDGSVTVTRDGTTTFEGIVSQRELVDGGANIQLTAADQRLELRYISVGRPFYEMDTGAIIRKGLSTRAEARSPVVVTDGSTIANWTGDPAYFELLGATNRRYHERGTDVIWAGWRAGATGDYAITFDSVPANAIPGDGQIMRLTTRVLVNNRGDQFEGEVDLRDNAGNNFIWTFPRLDTNFRTYTFAAEDATPTAAIGTPASTNGTLQYRFRIKGELPEPRAACIDFAQTLPFVEQSRSNSLGTSRVQASGRVITRRYDTNMMAVVADLATEDNAITYVDGSDLVYKPAADESAPESILYTGTPVVEAAFDRDYDTITNRVTVQGNPDKDIQATVSDSSSIEYYGVSPREEDLFKPNIQTVAEAQRYGRAFLSEHAWAETAMRFVVGDRAYESVDVGQRMRVKWPPESIDDVFTVSETTTDSAGYVTIGVTGHVS